MNIDDNISLIEYTLALEEGNITSELIKAVKDMNKTFDDVITIFNNILETEKTKIEDADISEIYEFIKTQYKNLGFNSFLNIKYIDSMLLLYLYSQYAQGMINSQKLAFINDILNEIESCKNKDVKDSVYLICLNYISRHNLILADKTITRKVLDYCKTIDPEKKYINVLPNEFVKL